MPAIKFNCQTGLIRADDFHHDYDGAIRKSGILEYNDIKHYPHGFYTYRWKYGNAELKLFSNFPEHWTRYYEDESIALVGK